MEKEKTSNKKKLLLGALAVLLLGGGIFGYKMYQDKQMQDLIDGGMVSPEPTLPAIDQKTFEELPVGVIYEVPEELQKQYIEAAKAKYEKYGHLGPQQKVFFGYANMHDQLKAREDVTPRDNNEPSDMLNDDMSLRYPDMFYGFIIHDESITAEVTKLSEDNRYEGYKKDNSLSSMMNKILFIEEYYANGGKISEHRTTLENEYLLDLSMTELPRNPSLQMMKEAIKSGLIKSSKDESINRLLFQYLSYYNMFGTLGTDIYNTAHSIMRVDNRWGFHEADGISMKNVSKYDVSDECTGTTPVYYYPVRVWKIDNNSIVVDIQIENGNHLQSEDILEIFVKLSQSNLSNVSKEYKTGDIVEYSQDQYVIYGRLFNSDITQGLFSEFGNYPINYKSLGNQDITRHTCSGQLFVPNTKAENLLRDFYSEVKEQLDNGGEPSTEKILKEVSKKNDVPYKDALAIYGAYYLQSVTTNTDTDIDWE